MRIITRKILILLAVLASCYSQVQADDAATTALNTLSMSNAMSFAMQAGFIGGAAQGCGQDLTVYSARIGEALDKLALNPTDKVLAMTNFQKTLLQARTAQMDKHPIPCNQVLQDFNGLPLMREDYQQSVLTQLNPTMGSPPSQQPAVLASAVPPPPPAPNPTVAQAPPSAPTQPAINPYAAAAANPSNGQNLAYAAPSNPAAQPVAPAATPYIQTLPSGSIQNYQAADPTASSQPPPYSARD